MKKALITILIIIFGIGIYMNFGMNQGAGENASIAGESASTATDEPPSEEASAEEAAEPAEEPTTDSSETVSFSQEALNEIHEAAVAENEPVIIDVVVPSYYTGDFINVLSQQFGTSHIEFNRIDLDSASPELETLTVSENSDAVIIDALQISDYNREVLPERDADRLENAYMNLYDAGKVVYLLGNPDAHQHENLAQVLEEEAEYFPQNDYYYIDNRGIEVEDAYYDYDSEMLTAPVEARIAQNIHEYMTE
ncbi:hypothetical protein [Salinicoccus luteus]|uniref:hypothetical protein n=1 Tax=Salinicoccus luteus TaxID=367840 RepID=UPI0004E0B40F|nr:hypothetical protein [Salinicoccus luteus]